MCSYISCCSLRMMGKLVFRCILRPASSMMLIMIMIMIMTMIIMMIILKGFHWHKPGSMMIAICLGTTQCQSCCAGCCLPAPIYIQKYCAMYICMYIYICMRLLLFSLSGNSCLPGSVLQTTLRGGLGRPVGRLEQTTFRIPYTWRKIRSHSIFNKQRYIIKEDVNM
ncbi:GD17973 [Drosophila simulans]|uniref:GD17973 n=1 Tax=Drosophila simulans TaxID=7240 RepID=B4R401_DROSI|nr:GD17973 [Drosophila simulans]